MPHDHDPELLVSRNLVLSCEGERDQTRVFVGIGYPKREGDNAKCQVIFEGLADRTSDIFGVDEFQALSLALKFAEKLLDDLPAGYNLHWLDGEPY